MNIISAFLGMALVVLWGIGSSAPRSGEIPMQDRQSAGARIDWMTFSEGMRQARLSKKRVLVNVCAKWCPWCKQMDEKAYSAKEIVDYIAMKYIPVKLDGEGKAETEYQGVRLSESNLADELGTKGYPTTIFLNYDGEFMVKLDGYLDKAVFFKVLQYIGEDVFETKSFTEFAGTSLSGSDGSSSSARKPPQDPEPTKDSSQVKKLR